MVQQKEWVDDWFRSGDEIIEEMSQADLGDRRLNRRNGTLAEMIASEPGKEFPEAARDEAEIEAFYRFLRHSKTTFNKIVAPHFGATADRLKESKSGEIFAIHDTTQFEFEGTFREGLGEVSGNKSDVQGFVGHLTLAVCDEMPAGFLATQLWRRKSKDTEASDSCLSTKSNEGDKWLEGIVSSEDRFGQSGRLIHLMDRGADAFENLVELTENHWRFVMRANQTRCVDNDIEGIESPKIGDALQEAPILGTKTIQLGRRDQSGRPLGARKTHPSRAARQTEVEIRSRKIQISVPAHYPEDLDSVEVQAVWVREVDPPDGAKPIDWTLYTSEPVDTFEQANKIVKWYQKRWLIEEAIGVVKGACRYEERQLESARTLTTALGLMMFAAWRLLALRALAQQKSDHPATKVLRQSQLKVLANESKTDLEEPSDTTVTEAMKAIAQMGGHLSHNGPPGWQVMYRGYRRLCIGEINFLQGQQNAFEVFEKLITNAENLDDMQKQLTQIQAELKENNL